jgi:DNA-binding GntR family transcriptional regulator
LGLDFRVSANVTLREAIRALQAEGLVVSDGDGAAALIERHIRGFYSRAK